MNISTPKRLMRVQAAMVSAYALVLSASVALAGPASASSNVSTDNVHMRKVPKNKNVRKSKRAGNSKKVSEQAFRVKVRELWGEHMEWTHAEVVGNFLADANPKLNRKATLAMMRMRITKALVKQFPKKFKK